MDKTQISKYTLEHMEKTQYLCCSQQRMRHRITLVRDQYVSSSNSCQEDYKATFPFYISFILSVGDEESITQQELSGPHPLLFLTFFKPPMSVWRR